MTDSEWDNLKAGDWISTLTGPPRMVLGTAHNLRLRTLSYVIVHKLKQRNRGYPQTVVHRQHHAKYARVAQPAGPQIEAASI
jgi:hypothetical protein